MSDIIANSIGNVIKGSLFTEDFLAELGFDTEKELVPIHYTYNRIQNPVSVTIEGKTETWQWPTYINEDGIEESQALASKSWGDLRMPNGAVYVYPLEKNMIDKMYQYHAVNGNILSESNIQFRMLKTCNDIKNGSYSLNKGNLIYGIYKNNVFDENSTGAIRSLIDRTDGPYLTKQVAAVLGNFKIENSSNFILGLGTDIVGFIFGLFGMNTWRFTPLMYYIDFSSQNLFFHASEYFKILYDIMKDVSGSAVKIETSTKNKFNIIYSSNENSKYPGRIKEFFDNFNPSPYTYIKNETCPDIYFPDSLHYTFLQNFIDSKWLSLSPELCTDGKGYKQTIITLPSTGEKFGLMLYRFCLIDNYGRILKTNILITDDLLLTAEIKYEEYINK